MQLPSLGLGLGLLMVEAAGVGLVLLVLLVSPVLVLHGALEQAVPDMAAMLASRARRMMQQLVMVVVKIVKMMVWALISPPVESAASSRGDLPVTVLLLSALLSAQLLQLGHTARVTKSWEVVL